tara:strand:+ start:204 stop:947 length:744 start_codon:yes stop_codon:yes gene_type:complete
MNKKKIIFTIKENTKTIFWALIIAVMIRSLIVQPFYIPSSSMEPTLLVGDRIFVTKYNYGISKHSFPFSPNVYNKRIFYEEPKQGDLIVFKTPADNRTDYIKRLIGLPGDIIQFIDGDIYINDKIIKREKYLGSMTARCGKVSFNVNSYEETLPNGVKHIAVYNSEGTLQNSRKFVVPKDHFFLLGDNRDCSRDSRYLDSVGYVNYLNLVGKAKIIFFSNDTFKNRLFKFWNLDDSLRLERTFKKIK